MSHMSCSYPLLLRLNILGIKLIQFIEKETWLQMQSHLISFCSKLPSCLNINGESHCPLSFLGASCSDHLIDFPNQFVLWIYLCVLFQSCHYHLEAYSTKFFVEAPLAMEEWLIKLSMVKYQQQSKQGRGCVMSPARRERGWDGSVFGVTVRGTLTASTQDEWGMELWAGMINSFEAVNPPP